MSSVNNLSNLNQLKNRKIYFCDIGARGGLPPSWETFSSDIYNIQFEADPAECQALINQKDGMVLPYALGGEDGKQTIFLTKERRCSSFYKPNLDFLKKFPESERFVIEDEVEVETKRMDSLVGSDTFKNIDFLKIDTQGSELEILQGSVEVLKNVIGIEVEVEFAEMYQGQPLFRDVDGFLNKSDFELTDLRKTYWKSACSRSMGSPKGQLIFGDALYLKKIPSLFKMCEENKEDAKNILLNAITIASVYGFLDYAFNIVTDQKVKDYFSLVEIESIRSTIEKESKSYYLPFILKRNIPLLPSLLAFLSGLFKSNHNGWAYADSTLGSRKKRNIFYTN